MDGFTIRDIYSGKPDAKDEINFDGFDNFIKAFVVADHFNIDSLIYGTNCFITGFKGTGKTALLFYLDSKLKSIDSSCCSSFVFFKDDFTDTKRNELQEMSKRLLSSIMLETDALIQASEFEYIWRWLLFKRIVSDNEYYGDNLFEKNENWTNFEAIIGKIKAPRDKTRFIVPNKIHVAIPYKNPTSMEEISPELEVDLRDTSGKQYREFVSLIDKAEEYFSKLTRTDIPYYIFVDELEAYYGDPIVFKRDLYMIRDLIFTVKRFNLIFTKSQMQNTKMICSVRSEILTAISRFIVTKEINKVISGFSVPLNWNYTNDNSYAHPIIQILLKRISICTENGKFSNFELYNKWFPEKIHTIEPASYILNNSWCKPRDMVRLITTAQNCLHSSSNAFTQAVFASLTKAYSDDSLQEIKEELRALYTSEEIDIIISCFTGYKTAFSVSELRDRISTYFKNTVLYDKFNQVLNDLYRLGFIGNFLPAGRVYHWQHKGDVSLIFSDEWRVCIHYALHSALSIGGKIDYVQNRGREPQIGDVSKAVVVKIIKYMILVRFSLYNREYDGYISANELCRHMNIKYSADLRPFVNIDDEFDVTIKLYNENHRDYLLQIID